MKKFITTTLPYSNNIAGGHIGHSFEFILADVIADYWRYKLWDGQVTLNVGLDEHGQKIAQKAEELGYTSVQEYCDVAAKNWEIFCQKLGVTYDNFYRTTDKEHKENALLFTGQLAEFIYEREYSGWYCVGCESFKTDKELDGGEILGGPNYDGPISEPITCTIHKQSCQYLAEQVKCFDIKRFASVIEDRLVDKTLSAELKNILASDFDFPITRKNVEWAIPFEGGTLHCWWEALTSYLTAAGLYHDEKLFQENWANSLQLCGKDNLKFQAYIFQAMLLAKGLPQTKEILVHGTILDEKGNKMSKSVGNVVDPIVQLEKYGVGPLRYYLTLGLSTFGDSAYSEKDLVKIWNTEVVGGFGNLITRTLHLVDTQNVDIDAGVARLWATGGAIFLECDRKSNEIEAAFERYDFHAVRELLGQWVGSLNRRINDERPFDEKTENRADILTEIWYSLTSLYRYYGFVLKDQDRIGKVLLAKKKEILFGKLEIKEAVPA